MQYLHDFLHSVRVPVHSILESNCIITEKVDGNALQVYNDNGTITYNKRSNTLFKQSKNPLTIFDMIIHVIYYNAYKHLHNYTDVFKRYKILNFEIFCIHEDTHVIKYTEGKYKNDIVLLSGMDLNDRILTDEEIKNIAGEINVSYNKILWEGIFSNDVIESLFTNKDDPMKLWDIITQNYCNQITHANIEGIVLTFDNVNFKSKRQVKIYSPEFKHKLVNHLENEKKEKDDINLEHIYDKFIDNDIFGYNELSHPVTKLLELYMACEVVSEDFTEIEKTLEKVEIIRNVQINTVLARKYYPLLPDKDDLEYPMILNFIMLAFRNKRTKHPLWCSLEYQLNKVNPYLDNYIFNNLITIKD